MSHSLNSLKWVLWGLIKGSIVGAIQRDAWSLGYSSHSGSLATPCACGMPTSLAKTSDAVLHAQGIF